MSNVHWMDFSGAPPFLLQERHLHLWNGMHVPLADLDDSADSELIDGRAFVVDATLDFKNPRTDYDRLCAAALAARESHGLYPVGDGHGLYIHGRISDTVGWWHEQQLLISYCHALPDPALLDGLTWTDEVLWRVETAEIVLFNSTLHGSNLANHPRWCEPFYLQPGLYSVVRAHYEHPTDDWDAVLYRFRRVG